LLSRISFWVVIALALTLAFMGGTAAASLRNTVFDVGGGTTGLMFGGIPRFVDSFKHGFAADGGGSKPSTPSTGWNSPGLDSGVWAPPTTAKPKHPKAPA